MSKVGLAKFAYIGSPKGTRSVSFEDSEVAPKAEHWSWRKRGRRNKLSTTHNADYWRKRQQIIDSI